MIKSKTYRVFASLIAVLMLVMSFNIGVYDVKANDANNATGEYEIYPKPQSIEYASGEFDFSGSINVVYGKNIDDATKKRLQEVASLKEGVQLKESAIVEEGTKTILVGSMDSEDTDVVEKYFTEKYQLKTTDLFTKIDSYVLSIKDNTIMVMGKDTDSAFYGLTTLYHIVKQLSDSKIKNLAIEDYADVASRGFIEGYYGNPWSTDDRIKLMEWGGYYKLNSYFYAPKDDPKHNKNWRELYTPEEINEKIKPLAEAGNNSKCRFVYALHPYMNNAIRYNTEENYQADLKTLQDKFNQVIEAGVRQIAILADDAANVGQENYIKTLNDMVNWLKEKQKTYPDLKVTLPFCTQEYMSNGKEYYRQFPQEVQIVMTGGKVWGEVSQSFTDTFTATAGRGPYMWVNWPCTDNSKKHLIMGGFKDFLHPGVNPSNIQGIVLNPMQQSEPSKVAIFGNACYSWNIWNSPEEADTAWNDSFKYVDHNSAIETEASNALRELSKHMINQNMDGRVRVLEESVELKEKLNPFKDSLTTGTPTVEKADELINEFKILQDATNTFNQQAGDERLKNQMVYWLNCWTDTTSAALNYLNGIKAHINNNEDNAVIWDYYSKGKAAFEKSKTYGFHYVDHTEYAEVGVQHIVPFIKAMESYLSDIVSSFVDPERQIIKPITSRSDAPTSVIENMIDGKDSTFAQWKTPNLSKVDEYYGVSYSKPIDITEVKFLVSDKADGKVNFFTGSKLQYTNDGKVWKDIPDVNEFGSVYEIGAADLNLTDVKGVRVICTKNTDNIWPTVREIYINGKPVNAGEEGAYNPKVIRTDRYKPHGNNGEDLLTDGNDNTFVWYNTGTGDESRVGDFVGIDLGKVMPIEKVKFIMGANSNDHWNKYTLEYSENGTEYKEINSYTQTNQENKKIINEDLKGQNIKARYVRVRNTEHKKVWLKMSEFTVTANLSAGVVDTNNEELKDIVTNVTLDTATITPTENITLKPNDYIGVDLGRIKDLTSVVVEKTNGDNLTLESSKNYQQWTSLNTTAKASEFDDARYVRLTNKTDNNVTFNLTKFEIKSKEIQAPFLKDSNIGINSSWGQAEDSRNNGAAFDGNIDTTTEFADFPKKDQYIIYDLGQERNIKKIQLFCQDQAVNYIRDADILVSNDLNAEQWTKVVTIGDGVKNTDSNDGNVKCIDAKTQDNKSVYTTSTTYPNKVYVEGSVNETKARYLKINMTADNDYRAVLFNEIVINDGEYVPVSNDPSFKSDAIEVQGMQPQNMIDGNLNTAYKPNTKDKGYVSYTLSEKLDVSKVNIIQNGDPSGAKVSFLVEGKQKAQEWVEVGALDKSLNEFYFPFWDKVYEVKIEWNADKIPTIAEMIFINDKQFGTDHTVLDEYIKSLNINENDYTSSSYAEFKTAYDKAVAVNNDSQSTTTELEQAKQGLEQAVAKLVKRGDITKVQAELDKIAKLNKDDYTQDSWNALQQVVTQANELIKNAADVTEPQVNEMVLNLQKAQTSLVSIDKVTKDDLQKLINSNGLDKIDTSLYMSDTANAFKQALDTANAVIANASPTQEELTNAYKNLQTAFANLQLKATAEQIEQLKALANSFVESSYTTSSWSKFAPVLNEVNQALNGEISSTNAQTLLQKLTDAGNALVRRGDTSYLNNLLNAVASVDSSKYTKESYDNLMKVYNEVNEALKNSANLSQGDIDALVQKLDSAYKALKPIGGTNVGNGNTEIPTTGDSGVNILFVTLGLLSLISLCVVARKKNLFNK